MKKEFDVEKSDRKLVDFILKTCRKRNVEDVVGGECTEKNIFIVYRNIFDIFYRERAERISEKERNEIMKMDDINEHSKEIENERKDEKLKKKTEVRKNIEKFEKISSENILEDIDKIEKEKSSYEENMKTTFKIYINDFVDEELVILIDYLLAKHFSSPELVFKILFVFFSRLGFDKIFLGQIITENELTQNLDLDFFNLLNETTEFKFVKVFIKICIENDSKLLDSVFDLSFCYSASTFCEILSFLIANCEEKIREKIKKYDQDIKKIINEGIDKETTEGIEYKKNDCDTKTKNNINIKDAVGSVKNNEENFNDTKKNS
ncbi:hypothetical protein GVAV_001612 [Gurleya vavrai]